MKKSQMGPKYQTAFDVTPYLRNGLTKREVLELKDAFDLLDPIASGNIDPQGTNLPI
jgi:Ca2+-binding EF-hand superfamily protein